MLDLQGQATSVLECRCPAEFSFDPEKTHLPVALVILKTLISLFRCVWLGLELNSTDSGTTGPMLPT